MEWTLRLLVIFFVGWYYFNCQLLLPQMTYENILKLGKLKKNYRSLEINGVKKLFNLCWGSQCKEGIDKVFIESAIWMTFDQTIICN